MRGKQCVAVWFGFCCLVVVPVGWGRSPEQAAQRHKPVVVTGSHLSGRIDTPRVTVIDRQELALRGWPRISELARALVSVSGVDGQSNQFTSNGTAGASNINLRGLGPARTLVLLNGRRLAVSPFALDDQAQSFVDLNHLPIVAMDRIEVLDQGAGSIYGSDAVAGVVNMITGQSGEGLGATWRHRSIGSGGSESHISASMGWRGHRGEFRGWLSYDARGRIGLMDRDWAVRPFADNPRGGWSGIGNPGAFVARDAQGMLSGQIVADAGCAELGGVVSSSSCRFQYTRFVNLVEEEHRWLAFGEGLLEFGFGRLRLEALWASTDVPRWQTSPSTPPQLWTEQEIASDHPALERWRADNPELASRVYGDLDPSATVLVFLGRPLGASGNPLTSSGAAQGYRRRHLWRIGADIRIDPGSSDQAVEIGAFVSRSSGERASADTYRAGFVNALGGYGLCSDPVTGQIPVGARPGVGGCVYFNPFSSAIAVSRINGVENIGYVWELANSPELIDWLRDPVVVSAVNDLVTLDIKYTGSWLGFVWAVGAQSRLESRRLEPEAINDLLRTPGPDRTGVFSFLAATEPVSVSRAVTAAFVEVLYEPMPALSVTGALRYENYGAVSAIDPALVMGWQDFGLSVRASVQGMVRGPGLDQIAGVQTSLRYVAPTGAFRAIDRHGSGDLIPETGFQGAVDVAYSGEGLSLSLRLWGIALRDAIVVYDHSDIVSLAVAALERGDLSADILSRITFQSGFRRSPATIARVSTELANGPDIAVSGIDASGALEWEAGGGSWRIWSQASYMVQYSVSEYAIDGNRLGSSEVVGQLNISNAFRPLPRFRARVGIDHLRGSHIGRLSFSYTGSYRDERSDVAIGQMGVLDASYRYRFSDRTSFGIAVSNIFDVLPPEVGTDVNYDPYTHSPLGRAVTVDLSVDLGG